MPKRRRAYKQQSRTFVRNFDAVSKKHRKDFDWRPKKRNPFLRPEGPQWRTRIYASILISALLLMFGILSFHSIFRISQVSISGLQRIDQIEFESATRAIMDTKKFFFLPGDNFFHIDIPELKDILLSRYPIQDISIEKVFPGTLTIAVNERISTIIYDNGDEYVYIGLNGHVVELLRTIGENEWYEVTQTVSSTREDGTVELKEEVIDRYHIPDVSAVRNDLGDYPIVYDTRHLDVTVQASVLEKQTVDGIVSWFNMMRQKEIPLSYIEIDHELGEATLFTSEGWSLHVNVIEEIERQVADMEYILTHHATRPHIKYIDLRYKGRVYWQ